MAAIWLFALFARAVQGHILREYYFDATARTWSDAKEFCNEFYQGLATIQTAVDWDIATNTIPTLINAEVTKVWIGLNDIDVEGNWTWDDSSVCADTSNNASTTYHDCSEFWSESEPNQKGGHGPADCAELRWKNGVWGLSDVNCAVTRPTLCNKAWTQVYAYNDTKMTWTQAKTYCETHHDGLAVIESANDYISALQNIPLGRSHVWLALNSRSNGTWQWDHAPWACSGANNVTHDCSAYWAEHEPNDKNNEEQCAELVNWGTVWVINDQNCNDSSHVLCNKRYTAPPTAAPSPYPQNDRYVYIATHFAWADGWLFCEENYYGLATIQTDDDLQQATELIPRTFGEDVDWVWIGLNDLDKEARWQWSDGTPCAVSTANCTQFWWQDEPDDSPHGADCVELRWSDDEQRWGFGDWRCDTAQPIICNAAAVTTSTTTTTATTSVATSTSSTAEIVTANEAVDNTTGVNKMNSMNAQDSSDTESKKVSTLESALIALVLLLSVVIAVMACYMVRMKRLYKQLDDEEMSRRQSISVSALPTISHGKKNLMQSMQQEMDIQLVSNEPVPL
mmetsp:Transcript_22279/g.35768  ORF Transcript_22279/g.35768 Transcript_22279/m.35768 type:complete len:566 (+) Transcript_22279:24-1721(+)